MKLDAYLAQTKKRAAAFAKQVGVPSSTITRLIKGERGASLGLALRIEKETDGMVTPSDLDRSSVGRDAPEAA